MELLLPWLGQLLSPALLLTIGGMVWRQGIASERRYTKLEDTVNTLDRNMSELWRQFNDTKEKLSNVRESLAEERGHRRGQGAQGD